MSGDLRERLEALSAGATQGEWWRQKTYSDTFIGTKKRYIDSLAFVVASFETHQGIKDEARDRNLDNAGLIVSLVNAFRSGDLVTRSEMEEAVAEAVAKEREAVSQLVDASQWARNRLEKIADDSWHGDGRDLKRSLVGVFADFDDALKKCNSEMPEHFRARSEQNDDKPKTTMASFCAMTCQEGAFQKFLAETFAEPCENADQATAIVKRACGIYSRKELNVDGLPRSSWLALKSKYENWLRT